MGRKHSFQWMIIIVPMTMNGKFPRKQSHISAGQITLVNYVDCPFMDDVLDDFTF